MGNSSQLKTQSSQLQSSKTVLLVEDNEKLNEINRRALESKGYQVRTALTLAQAWASLAQTDPDVILLDVVLPDGDGFSFCEEVRDKTDAHIIFLTSRREHEDKLRGLSLGGDDYITKPFRLDELLLRVASAMRRRGKESQKRQSAIEAVPSTLTVGNLTLDFITGQATADDTDLPLTKMEFILLGVFSHNVGRVMSAEEIYEKAWKRPMHGDKGSLRKRISETRAKLKSGNCTHNINNVYGVGYCFERQ